ncbi:MAG: aspartate aminotransferase [Phormidesmis sp. RL_2_1]|nr:aspartate aminotransferase [Phormidesmis sp. RL_2_1]
MTLDWLKPAERLGSLPPYVFARLDELKANAQAQGVDLIDLGMGNPGGPTPQPVIEAALGAIQDERNHGYPPFEGTASFRRAITSWYHRRYGVKLDPDGEALPLMGSKEGLGHLAMAYINPGDVVLVPTPAYPAHFRGPAIAGADIHTILLRAENNWLIDFDDIPTDLAKKAKVLFFNYPNNPTGAVAPKSFFEEMVAFAQQHQILLIHDLCYAELAFDGYQPTSLLEIPGAKDISVEFHTLSKTYNMAGWRVGFVVGNRHVIQGLRTLKTNLDYGIFSALQKAAEAALQLPDHFLTEVQQRYSSRRDFLIKALATLGWQVDKPSAAMYLWVACPPGIGAADFAFLLLQKTGIVVTPGTAFGEGGEGYIRISLIAECDRLAEAVERLKTANIRYDSVPSHF